MSANVRILLLIIALMWGVERLQAQQTPPISNRPAASEIKSWIAKLANRDPRPFSEPFVLEAPQDVNRDSLRIVKNAYDKLSANAADSLPFLIDSIEDERYSYYQESPSGAFVCRTVGHACHSIIVANIEIYHPYATVPDETGRQRTVHFITAMGGAKKWFSERNDRSLFELQREAIEWSLGQPKPEPQEFVADEDWNRCIGELRQFYNGFRRSAKPVIVNNELWFEGK